MVDVCTYVAYIADDNQSANGKTDAAHPPRPRCSGFWVQTWTANPPPTTPPNGSHKKNEPIASHYCVSACAFPHASIHQPSKPTWRVPRRDMCLSKKNDGAVAIVSFLGALPPRWRLQQRNPSIRALRD